MNRIIFSFFYFLVSSLFLAAQQLKLDWNFCLSGSESWNQATVPGCNFTDLRAIDAIPDPFYASNEDSVQWVAKCNWTYRSESFEISDEMLSAKQIILRFPILDGHCTVYFNGKKIIEADNSFRVWEADVIKLAKPAENHIRINFKSPVNEALRMSAEYGFLPTGEPRVFIRKAPYQFGWDWGPNLPSVGIGAMPELIAFHNIELYDYRVITKNLHEQEAEMELIVEIDSRKKSNIDLQFSIPNGFVLNTKIQTLKGKHQYTIPFKITEPQLWWPHDQGNPFLYESNLKLTQVSNALLMSKHFGIRKIKLIQEPGPTLDARGFAFEVNGTPVFIKGANYIPQHVFLNEVSDEDYRSILNDAVSSNMNMIRVWGGGVYEKEIFYNLCDSLGILIWQDFMFACAMYPGNSAFLSNVEQEAKEQTRRISAHPCIALFCGNNEISEGWARWGWKDLLSKFQVSKLQTAYDHLFLNILPEVVEENSYTHYWESSPELGRGDPQHVSKGDAHYWGVWHDAEPFENFRLKVPRFMSEFGFQSYPSIYNLSNYIPESEMHIGSSAMNTHQKHSRGDQLINEYMLRWFKVPDDFDRFVYLSQVLQAEGMRIGIDAQIASRPYCMGTLFWQFNDCWPAVSWSSRDHEGRWKMMQYVVKDTYEPVRILANSKNESLEIQIVNSISTDLNTIVEWQLMDVYGNVLQMAEFEIVANAQSNTLVKDFNLTIKSSPVSPLFLVFKLSAGSFEDSHIHYLSEIEEYVLPENKLIFSMRRSGNDRIIELSSSQLERGVWIEANKAGTFSDNYFDLLPGEKRSIVFNSNSDAIDFKIQSFSYVGYEFNEEIFAPFMHEPIKLSSPQNKIEYKWSTPPYE